MSEETNPEAWMASEQPAAPAWPPRAAPAPAPEQSQEVPDPVPPGEAEASGSNGEASGDPATTPARRRRRRGSRGGRNRRRPGAKAGVDDVGDADADADGEDDEDTEDEDDSDSSEVAGVTEAVAAGDGSEPAAASADADSGADRRADTGSPAAKGAEAEGSGDPRRSRSGSGPGRTAPDGTLRPPRKATGTSGRATAEPAAPKGERDGQRSGRSQRGAAAEASAGGPMLEKQPPVADAQAAETAETTAPTPRRRRRGRGGGVKDGSATAGAATEPAGKAAEGGGTGGTRARTGGRGDQGRGRSRAPEPVLDLDDVDDLDDATLARRQGRTRKGRPTGRYFMVVQVRPGIGTQVAVLEGRSLVEHYVSRPTDSNTQIDGNIYLGKVQNVLPGMEAAFVDIGTPKNGVLYRDDVTFDESEMDTKRPRIERMLRNGQSVIVQVTKNPIGTKGARLTQEVSLAGRFVVMIPNQPGTYGISKRLSDEERKRLRKILDEIRPPDAGLIVRTAADGASADELHRDMRRLQQQWEEISGKAAKNRPAVLLHQEPDLAIRVIREEFNKEYRGIVIDDPALYDEVRRYVEAISPELADRVELYSDKLPIFERFHVHEQLHKALERKVWLPSGGSIIIERTEALTVIDVNTAKNVGRSTLEETVFANNLEAAEEVARQLRLRDIGGIIVIDFIDMEIRKNREEVVRKFKEALARDKTRTQVFEISELGLVEMTRKRISEGLVESFSTVCPNCEGRGIIVDHSLL